MRMSAIWIINMHMIPEPKLSKPIKSIVFTNHCKNHNHQRLKEKNKNEKEKNDK